jgi:hypothetical protein
MDSVPGGAPLAVGEAPSPSGCGPRTPTSPSGSGSAGAGSAARGDRARSPQSISFGPPERKTTLARIIADTTKARFVFSGCRDQEIRDVMAEAEYTDATGAARCVHRRDPPLNKAQQDAFLPRVRRDTLIGATTRMSFR